jgi:hypothetical protein
MDDTCVHVERKETIVPFMVSLMCRVRVGCPYASATCGAKKKGNIIILLHDLYPGYMLVACYMQRTLASLYLLLFLCIY